MLPRAAAIVLAALALAQVGCGGAERPGGRGPTSGSTLRATLTDPDGNGFLERGPAMALTERRDLGGGGRPGREIARFGQITDAHVRDEESPARVPFLDRLGSPFESAFRPQEAETAQVLDAAVRALDEEHPQAVAVTGDLADNAQANELDLAIGVLRGARADPSSGAPRYEGVQQGDNPDPYYYRPDNDAPRHPGLTAAAQRPFEATGLDAPWFPVLGNHDALVQGEVPSTPAIEALATGSRMLTDLDRDVRPPGDEASAPAVVDALLDDPAGLPGRTREVTPDPRRRTLSPAQAVERLRAAAPGTGTAAGRLDYTFDIGDRVRAIVLDTVRREGGSGGVVLPEQVQWLERELRRAGDRSVVVFSHNPLDDSEGGAAALAALGAPGNVVAAISGHRHRNAIEPDPGGFWRVSTASLADFPQQTRMFCLREVAGGGLALDTWMVDHDGRGVAGPARELAYLDAQGGRPQNFAGRRSDRNARLYLP
jgi:3',5'-cyclic AMP phosphodiesterase CpdA